MFIYLLLATLAATSLSAQVKFNPGHYLVLNGNDTLSSHLKNIDQIASVGSIKGVQVKILWKDLETSRGVYNFSTIDTLLERVARYNKRLVVHVIDRKFGTTNPANIIPNYMMTTTYRGGVTKSKTGYVARIWEPNVMDRLIALYRAIGSRYNSHRYFEGIATGEATLALPSPAPSGYSHSALATQYERLMVNARSAMPNTALFMNVNWLGTLDTVSRLVQALVRPYASVNSANTVPGKMNHGQIVWTGGGSMGAEYRGLLAIATSVEHGELGGPTGNFTPAQIGSFAYNTLKADHVFWVRNSWSGAASQRWDTGILPYLKTNPPVRTACPSTYGSCTK